jgi:class 3 adenylate cyclase
VGGAAPDCQTLAGWQLQSPEARFDGDALKRSRMTTDLPSGTVTFLFTDNEGSTPLWEREPGPMRPRERAHESIRAAACTIHLAGVSVVVARMARSSEIG